LFSIPDFAYAGRRWLDCGIEQSAGIEQALAARRQPRIGTKSVAGLHYQVEHLRRLFDTEKLQHGVKSRRPTARP